MILDNLMLFECSEDDVLGAQAALRDLSGETAALILTNAGMLFFCHGAETPGWQIRKAHQPYLRYADMVACCHPANLHWSWRLHAKVGCKLLFPKHLGTISCIQLTSEVLAQMEEAGICSGLSTGLIIVPD